MKKRLIQLTILGLLYFLCQELYIIYDGLNDDTEKARFAVILGSKVNEDGTLSSRLKARVDKGLALYQNHQIQKIYVSGGLGKEGYYEGTEMANYLIQKGVKRKDIFIDDEGINTRATALNFHRDFPNEKEVIVISQYFHITRCKLALRQVGIPHVYGVHCDFFEWRDPYSLFREFFGWYKYYFFY